MRATTSPGVAADLDGRVVAVAMVAIVAACATAAVTSGRVAPVLLIAIVMPALVAMLRRPQRGLLVLAALVPFDGLLLVVPGGSAVSGWKEALVLTLVAGTFVASPDARRTTGHRPGWVPGVAAYAALGLISAVLVGGSRGLLGAKIGFFYLLVAVVAWRCPLDRRERDRLVTILMVTGVVTAVVGIVQQLIGPVRLHELGFEYNSTIRFAGGYLRSFSTFTQPFPFGFFLMLVLLVGLAQALQEPRRLRNRLFLVAVPIIAIGLATSVVRGAWLGLAAGLVYLAVTRHRGLVVVLVLAVAGFALLPADATGAVLSSSSSEERVEGWESNVARAVEHPLGEGIGATGAVAERLRSEGDRVDDVYQPDNYFVKTGIELGVLGLWLFVLSVLAALQTAHRAAAAPGRDGAIAAGTAAYIVAALAASIVSTFFEIFPMEVYFWLLLTVVSGVLPAPVAAGLRRPPVRIGPATTGVPA